MEYFKDISNYLSREYPDRKVYVISDQHFNHKNIINYTRKELFQSENMDIAVEKMNNHIISCHNEVVDKEDIVLILGDFSFQTNLDKLSDLVSKLNGHKFLVMGNHDSVDRPSLYLKAGFERVFLSPIKFNGDFYSHYPLNASAQSKERPDTILYRCLCEEFKNSDSGINYHGHQHTLINNGPREKNISCEQLDYRPLFVGKTKQNSIQTNIDYPYLGEEFYEIAHKVMLKYGNLQENSILVDYLYTILLEVMTKYQEKSMVFGSLLLNKKYHSRFIPSDLDVSILYDSTQSISSNKNAFKQIRDDIFRQMVQIEGINTDFYKKIDFICILSFIYASKSNQMKGYLDMHMLYDEFYKSEDFIKMNGTSLLEEYGKRIGIAEPKTIRYPKFTVKTTTAFSEIMNYFLQYIYATNPEKKPLLFRKINLIMENLDNSTQMNFEQLQNMFIRFLLRNIYFFEKCNRTKESEHVLAMNKIEIPPFSLKKGLIADYLKQISIGTDYNSILKSIQNAKDRKKEISRILTYYKN